MYCTYRTFVLVPIGLCELAKLGPSLRYLSVAKCSSITDTALRHRHQFLQLHGHLWELVLLWDPIENFGIKITHNFIHTRMQSPRVLFFCQPIDDEKLAFML